MGFCFFKKILGTVLSLFSAVNKSVGSVKLCANKILVLPLFIHKLKM